MSVYSKDCLKGKYQPKNASKYKGNLSNIVFRSSLELHMMKWCDSNPNVIQWGSEEVIVPYISPKDGQMHRYFVDFFVKVRNKEGEVKKFWVEVKPKRFTQEPKIPKRRTNKFLQEVLNWGQNKAKWEAARKEAKRHGSEFLILTEEHLGVERRSKK